VRRGDWKAYRGKKGGWELYDLAADLEEKNNVAAQHAKVLEELVAIAKAAHEPIRKGEIFDRELTDKDHRQAPHQRNVEYLRATLNE
jgi:predicted DNA binding protein